MQTGLDVLPAVWPGRLFPLLFKPPGYRERLEAAAPISRTATRRQATLCPSWADNLRLLDATPVPCGASWQTVRGREPTGWANDCYCAAHSCQYRELKL